MSDWFSWDAWGPYTDRLTNAELAKRNDRDILYDHRRDLLHGAAHIGAAYATGGSSIPYTAYRLLTSAADKKINDYFSMPPPQVGTRKWGSSKFVGARNSGRYTRAKRASYGRRSTFSGYRPRYPSFYRRRFRRRWY